MGFLNFGKKPVISSKRTYGWKRDLPDFRDVRFSLPTATTLAPLPPLVNLQKFCPPIQDQGNLGSCTAHALTAAIEFLELKDVHPLRMLSRLFLYYNERAVEGTVRTDSGAAIRDGIKVLKSQGCCLEALWPYNINRFTQKPNNNCYANAITHDIIQYQALSNLNDMKACLASGFPFVYGFSVYESFESDSVAQTGIVPMPAFTEQFLGGHAVCCVGYDDSKNLFLTRNSWGTGWGQSGYFQIPYTYLTNPNLASDFWTIRKTKSE